MLPSAKKRDDRQYALHRAKELADSGRFAGWLGVELELRYVEGFQYARVWLDNVPIRAELDAICQQATTRKS